MKIVEEGVFAFCGQIDRLLTQAELAPEDRRLLRQAQANIRSGHAWNAVLLDLLSSLTARVMALSLSPELREFYSLLYQNRIALEKLQKNIEGSMTLLMIFD